jgi:hypothetical protein
MFRRVTGLAGHAFIVIKEAAWAQVGMSGGNTQPVQHTFLVRPETSGI